MTERIRLTIWTLALCWPPCTMLLTTPDLFVHLRSPTLPGQTIYYVSKFTALYAAVLLWLQAIGGLLSRREAQALVLPGPEQHRWLGLLVLGLVALHGGTFVLAVSIRAGHPSLDWFVPAFNAGYYKSIVSLGVIGLLCLVAAAIAALLRRRSTHWRILHRTALAGVALGGIHSLAIGSETRSWISIIGYMLMGLGLLWARLWRLQGHRVALRVE
ncbi:MAG: hypothetical protein AB1651_08735 [Pseudomonadota bacterium]